MARMSDIPMQTEIESEVWGRTLVFRRRAVKDTFAISARQVALLGNSPVFANPEAQNLSYYIAELETVLVAPEGFKFDEQFEDYEITRVAREYEKWSDSFRHPSAPRPEAVGAAPAG